MRRGRRRNRGFTLVELLVVVLIIGLLATIAIPRLLAALNRARQKRTMADMRTISIAVENYNGDNSFYPILGDSNATALDVVLKDPAGYIPHHDGWIHEILYSASDGRHYTLISYGADQAPDTPYLYGEIHRFEDDLVIQDTSWMQWPAGVQND